MKKTEILIVALCLLAMAMDLLLLPGGAILSLLSILVLSGFYMIFGFAIFNGIGFRGIFKKDSYAGASAARITGSVLSGIAFAIALIGILFKYFSWPGGYFMLLIGLAAIPILCVVLFVKLLSKPTGFYKKMMLRTVLIGGSGLLFILVPSITWIEFKFRNYPKYIEAYKKAQADPNNMELWMKAEEEREKAVGED